ncbi:MAG: right-handed parallel beta-helix repeat-containing protein [Labilithrix sp.]|nr:right-handed parallel beta-helix repeat-containing protein [Labilithrix sp.]
MLALACALGVPACVTTKAPATSPIILRASDDEERVQAAFAAAKDGQRIALGPGRFRLRSTLALTASDVVVRGAGRDATILDFADQVAGSEGVFVASKARVTLEALSVVDARGDGIKALGIDGLVMRDLGVGWSGEPQVHGPYGLYPVDAKHVLIEDCVVTGASDAGIYVGQSSNAVVRRNDVHGNVAGIEIENSSFVDVHDNRAHDNSAGILVFDLPGLPRKNGHDVRVHHNAVVHNDVESFAAEGSVVGLVPRGTGILVMATTGVDIFANRIADNATFGVAVVSYLVTRRRIDDPAYDPHPSRVSIHDNVFSGGGHSPDPKSELVEPLRRIATDLPGRRVPAIVYDGERSDPRALCVRDNGAAKVLTLSPAISLDARAYDCAGDR